jgi:hypothetical protein
MSFDTLGYAQGLVPPTMDGVTNLSWPGAWNKWQSQLFPKPIHTVHMVFMNHLDVGACAVPRFPRMHHTANPLPHAGLAATTSVRPSLPTHAPLVLQATQAISTPSTPNVSFAPPPPLPRMAARTPPSPSRAIGALPGSACFRSPPVFPACRPGEHCPTPTPTVFADMSRPPLSGVLQLAQDMRNLEGTDRFIYITHTWLLSLFFNCAIPHLPSSPPPLFICAWPSHAPCDLGPCSDTNSTTCPALTLENPLAPPMACPTSDELAFIHDAIMRGDIRWHGEPFNFEVRVLPAGARAGGKGEGAAAASTPPFDTGGEHGARAFRGRPSSGPRV